MSDIQPVVSPHDLSIDDQADDSVWVFPDKLEALQRFASLGRQDVYAERIHTGAYFPRREALSAAVLEQHLSGSLAAGIYLYDSGADRSRLLLFDLDDHDQQLQWTKLSEVALRLCSAAASRGVSLWP